MPQFHWDQIDSETAGYLSENKIGARVPNCWMAHSGNLNVAKVVHTMFLFMSFYVHVYGETHIDYSMPCIHCIEPTWNSYRNRAGVRQSSPCESINWGEVWFCTHCSISSPVAASLTVASLCWPNTPAKKWWAPEDKCLFTNRLNLFSYSKQKERESVICKIHSSESMCCSWSDSSRWLVRD